MCQHLYSTPLAGGRGQKKSTLCTLAKKLKIVDHPLEYSMILNHSKTIRSIIYPYCAQYTATEMHSRDITLLIVLLLLLLTLYSDQH